MVAGHFNNLSRAGLKTVGARQPLSIPALRHLRLDGAASRTEKNERLNVGSVDRAANVRFWIGSDLSAFGQFQSILHVHAQVADRAVDLGMAEKDLNGAEIASCLVDDRCFVRRSECVP